MSVESCQSFSVTPNEKFFRRITNHERDFDISSTTYVSLNDEKLCCLGMIGDFRNLVILNISSNHLREIDGIKNCEKLIKLDISSNLLESLPNEEFWRTFQNLIILYLNNNPLNRRDDIVGLSATFANIVQFTLIPDEIDRNDLIELIPHLQILNNQIIKFSEKHVEYEKRTNFFDELSHTLPTNYHVNTINEELNEIFNIITKYHKMEAHLNPVIIIQRYIRRYLHMKNYFNKIINLPNSPMLSNPSMTYERDDRSINLLNEIIRKSIGLNEKEIKSPKTASNGSNVLRISSMVYSDGDCRSMLKRNDIENGKKRLIKIRHEEKLLCGTLANLKKIEREKELKELVEMGRRRREKSKKPKSELSTLFVFETVSRNHEINRRKESIRSKRELVERMKKSHRTICGRNELVKKESLLRINRDRLTDSLDVNDEMERRTERELMTMKNDREKLMMERQLRMRNQMDLKNSKIFAAHCSMLSKTHSQQQIRLSRLVKLNDKQKRILSHHNDFFK
ncbi:hypothetical protein SNEBB_006403 [Seison nebaliae]|nr:hypothetical protein SNEBB_006403 [Seison nebaliae]